MFHLHYSVIWIQKTVILKGAESLIQTWERKLWEFTFLQPQLLRTLVIPHQPANLWIEPRETFKDISTALPIRFYLRISFLVFNEEVVGIFGFGYMAKFWFGVSVFAHKTAEFRFSHLKLPFFGFGVLRGLRVFSNLVWFSVFVNKEGFSLFLSKAFYGFSDFVKKVTPCSRDKTLIPRDHLYSAWPFLLVESGAMRNEWQAWSVYQPLFGS